MKLKLTAFCLAAVAIMSSCGVKQGSSSIKGLSGEEPLASIGRGAKIRLTKDFEVPPNALNVEFEPWAEEHLELAGKYWWRQTYIKCEINLREASLDRRVLQNGTIIELTGEVRKQPNADGSKPAWDVEALMVASPSALNEIGCIKLTRVCDNYHASCYPYRQIPVTIQDLERVLKNIAIVERPGPVVIPPN